MGIFGSGAKPMGYYTSQTAPREALGLGMTVDPPMAGAADRARGGGFFGGNRMWAGILGDILSGAAGRPGTYAPMMLQQRQQDREDERWQKRLNAQAALKGTPTPSTAAKMAAELGYQPGTPEWQKFITRYAFTPKLMTVGNAQGGEDQVEYDPSGMGGGAPQTQTVNGQTYYNINGEWYDNPEGR